MIKTRQKQTIQFKSPGCCLIFFFFCMCLFEDLEKEDKKSNNWYGVG